jgi:hypothetical protein
MQECYAGSRKVRTTSEETQNSSRYFEEFLSNFEDTDFSSFDRERSDTNSTRKDLLLHADRNSSCAPKDSLAAEAAGIVPGCNGKLPMIFRPKWDQ